MPPRHHLDVKICGLKDAVAVDAAVAAGADMLGFVFFPASPRAVTPAQAGALLAGALPAGLPGGPLCVGLFVDADDAQLAETLAAAPLDILQLHGSESPARCADIPARFGLPVMKAIGIATRGGLDALAGYAPVVDRVLLDAKPAPDAPLPGGNAHPFEWSLLAGLTVPRPWLLAGGLTPHNVKRAILAAGAPG
ncbi:MAG: phosphoribosylanthranilate isomerase, partial [Alphaproteobacteria bacterium]|nr:phosphoribosylanthranilate isomerase [Alphaproteobacteria bacterium]